jgi:hypothetical protein
MPLKTQELQGLFRYLSKDLRRWLPDWNLRFRRKCALYLPGL